MAEFTFTGIKRVSSYLLRETSLLALITVFNTSYLYLDTFLLKALKSDVEVGLFNAPYKLINIMALLILSFLSAVFPLLARSASKSGDAGTSESKTI
ncbi:MAG: oligosaccharide flippase family protein [Candidatus Lindowbacteria bacterium]|nr:oligosaccharide flippase family protein [Candidatus Lindowbacteria bacterium]